MGYLFILFAVFFNVLGQFLVKWRVKAMGPMPEPLSGKALYVFHLLLDPWVLSSFVSVFIAGIFWIGALSKFELSFAYPFMSSIAFITVLLFGVLLFNETITWQKAVGILVIICGIIITTRST